MSRSTKEPPLRFCALASGSKGNAVFVGGRDGGVLIDAGLPGRALEARLQIAGLDPGAIRAVVVTHEHRDHLCGAGVWARRHDVPLYLSRTTRCRAGRVLGRRGLERVTLREFEPGRAFAIDGLEFRPFATSHDAESVGFRVTDGHAVLGFATDLGCVGPAVRDALRRAHILYLESNHDEDLLWDGPYPQFLKRRIRSPWGHLSNAECASLAADLLHDQLQTLVLGHLSETNNQPHLAFSACRSILARSGALEDVTLLVARQDRAGRVVDISP